MIAFFLTISILLNLICLLAVVVLYVRQNRLVEFENKQKQSMQEMEDILTSFIYELKDENQQLYSILNNTNPSTSVSKPVPQAEEKKMDAKLDSSNAEGKKSEKIPSIKKGINPNLAKKAYSQKEVSVESKEELPPWLDLSKESPVENKNPLNPELQKQMIKLREEGNSIEAIAKAVNKGKSEVELTLKFFGIQ